MEVRLDLAAPIVVQGRLIRADLPRESPRSPCSRGRARALSVVAYCSAVCLARVNASVCAPAVTRSTKSRLLSVWLDFRRPLPRSCQSSSYSGGFHSTQSRGPRPEVSSSTSVIPVGSRPVTVATCSTGLLIVAEQQTNCGLDPNRSQVRASRRRGSWRPASRTPRGSCAPRRSRRTPATRRTSPTGARRTAAARSEACPGSTATRSAPGRARPASPRESRPVYDSTETPLPKPSP